MNQFGTGGPEFVDTIGDEKRSSHTTLYKRGCTHAGTFASRAVNTTPLGRSRDSPALPNASQSPNTSMISMPIKSMTSH